MSYELSWYIRNRVVHFRPHQGLDIKTLEEVCHKLSLFVNNGYPPVHCLLDFSDVMRVPTQTQRIKHALEEFLRSPNMGWVVLVTDDNPLVNFIMTVISQVMYLPLITVPTLEDAFEYLERLDPSLRKAS